MYSGARRSIAENGKLPELPKSSTNLQDLGDTTVKPKSAVFGGTFHIFTGAQLLSIYNVSRQLNIQRVQLQILSVQSTHLCTSD